MEIVAAFGCSHSGLIGSRNAQAPSMQRDAVSEGFARVRVAIAETQPDALLILATDHGRIYPLSHNPQWVIGVSATAKGIGDAELPQCEVPLHQGLAQAILHGAVERGVDLAFSEAMQIDHSFVMPLMLTTPELTQPIIPLVQNCRVPPMPPLRRGYEVGRVLGEVIRQGPPGRVVVMGTGGLSHWVGSDARREFMRQPAGTRFGREKEFPVTIQDRGWVNEEFDRLFLRTLESGQAGQFIDEWTDDRIESEAGNGALEIRNWITIAGMVNDAPMDVLGYAAVEEWLTGTAIGQFRL